QTHPFGGCSGGAGGVAVVVAAAWWWGCCGGGHGGGDEDESGSVVAVRCYRWWWGLDGGGGCGVRWWLLWCDDVGDGVDVVAAGGGSWINVKSSKLEIGTRVFIFPSQQQRIDCDETFSPVFKPDTIRTVLSLAVTRDWHIHQLDVKNAFLHGQLSETVSMHQPPGFVDSAHPDYVCHLQHSLGLDVAYLLLYVDDIVLTASSTALLQRIIILLHNEFAMTDLGSLNYLLGMYAQRTKSGLFLSQSKFAKDILERAHMHHCNPSKTPVDTKSKLESDGYPVSDPTLYRSLAGALQYLTFTRPDISYVVQQICLYMHDPRDPYFTALERILRYVRGTIDHGIQLHVSSTSQLTAYTDANWVTLSRSSAEAEYRGVANVVAETVWLRNLLLELYAPLSTATLVCCDNANVVYLFTNLVQHQRIKHIEIDIHFVREYVASGQVRVLHVPFRFRYADIFTKGLPTALFFEFRSSLNVRSPPAPTAGEY
nr:ribonuclease H-like domain-containing protein [Tanacetum cinerariifolium]